jgi:MinD-like ATPase involved in chromosome partitioning or flagellar assembly
MIRLALLTSNAAAADAIEQMLQDTGIFEMVYRSSRMSPSPAELRTLSSADPDVILLDCDDCQRMAPLTAQLNAVNRRGALIGFRQDLSPAQQKSLAAAGIVELLQDPFSHVELEKAALRAVHQRQPITHKNVVAFLPSKAGSGCSTVALNTAAMLANGLGQRTLLVEADRRSGALSILLDVDDGKGLSKVLPRSGMLTAIEWTQNIASIGKLDLLLTNPFSPGPLPSWLNYHQLLLFAEKQYDFIVVDLPEVVNPATAELLNAARSVFIVCEPEVTSLKLVPLRRAELEAAEISREKIYVLGNRWESNRLKREDLVRMAKAPMFAALPNDYKQIKEAVLESRLVSRNSPFGNACLELARRLADLPESEPFGSVSRLLRRFASK